MKKFLVSVIIGLGFTAEVLMFTVFIMWMSRQELIPECMEKTILMVTGFVACGIRTTCALFSVWKTRQKGGPVKQELNFRKKTVNIDRPIVPMREPLKFRHIDEKEKPILSNEEEEDWDDVDEDDIYDEDDDDEDDDDDWDYDDDTDDDDDEDDDEDWDEESLEELKPSKKLEFKKKLHFRKK